MSSLVCVTSGALSIWVLTCASLAAADWLSRSVFRFLSQIYQEDMMRSLLQNSLHVFRAISGTSTDLGWCLSHWPPSISATCPHCSLEDVNSKASGQLCVFFRPATLCQNSPLAKMPRGCLQHLCRRSSQHLDISIFKNVSHQRQLNVSMSSLGVNADSC